MVFLLPAFALFSSLLVAPASSQGGLSSFFPPGFPAPPPPPGGVLPAPVDEALLRRRCRCSNFFFRNRNGIRVRNLNVSIFMSDSF